MQQLLDCWYSPPPPPQKKRLTSSPTRNSTFATSASTWLEQVSSQGRVWTFCGNVCHPHCYARVFEFGTALFPTDAEPDLLLDGEDQPVGNAGLRAILTPGHTPGHVCVYDERNKLLFSGDHVLTGITTHITPGILSNDDQLSRYLESLEKVRALDVQMVLPAHEHPFANLSERVGQLLEHHEKRLHQVLAPIRHHALSARDIASQVEWMVGLWEQMDGINRLLAIQETLAHLRLLQERGLVITKEKEGVNLYSATK